jgi:hypothetical protein
MSPSRRGFLGGLAGILTLAGSAAATDEKDETCKGCGSTEVRPDGSCAHCRRALLRPPPGYPTAPNVLKDLPRLVVERGSTCERWRSLHISTDVSWDQAVPSGVSYMEHKLSLLDAFIVADGILCQRVGERCSDWIAGDMHTANVLLSLPTFTSFHLTRGDPLRGTLNCRWAFYELKDLPMGIWALGHGDDFVLGEILNCC